MQTVNIEYKNKNDFEAKLEEISFPLTSKDILVQVFSGNLSNTQEALNTIKQNLPNAIIVGSTSLNGEFLDDRLLIGSMAVSITYFEKSTLKIEKIKDNNFSDAGKFLAQKLNHEDLKVCILFLGEKCNFGDAFLSKFASNVHDDVFISGGLVGDCFGEKQTYIFYGNKILNDEAIGVGIYSKDLYVDLKYTYDWDIIGKEFTIEKAHNNVIMQIDGMTPKDLHTKYFGKDLEKDISFIRIYFPFITKRNGYKVSNYLLHVDENGYFHYNTGINEGEKVNFGIINRDKILRNLINMYNSIETQWESIFIFSGASRKTILEDKIACETKYFSKIAPTSGVFTYGQFFKTPSRKDLFLQQTLTALMLSESQKYICTKEVIKKEFTFYEASFNLVNTILKENSRTAKNINSTIKSQLTKLKQKNNTLKHELGYDPLTKLKNRKSLLIDKNRKNPNAIYLADIQSFSEINDLYGEKVGDVILQKVGNFISLYLKNLSTTPYRLHGDTFAIFSMNEHNKSVYKAIMTKFIKALESHDFSFSYGGVKIDLALHIRVGIALAKDCESRHSILENADMALKYAKKTKQDFVIYDSSLEIEKGYENDIRTIKLIKEALQEDRIIPYFQPIFKDDEISYEALMRLVKKDGTVLTPYQFLDIAKNTRLYVKLTQKMIEKSFQIFTRLPYRFSINLSYLDIQNENTITYLQKMIDKYNIKNQLTIEILESEIIENYDIVLSFINTVKKMGINISIDDFGSGYSNFSQIIKLNPDYIKIDGSLIKNIDTDPKTFAVTKAINSFAKDMNIKTIAEFIHSKEVYEKAKTLGIDGYQGFYLGMPQSAEEIFG